MFGWRNFDSRHTFCHSALFSCVLVAVKRSIQNFKCDSKKKKPFSLLRKIKRKKKWWTREYERKKMKERESERGREREWATNRKKASLWHAYAFKARRKATRRQRNNLFSFEKPTYIRYARRLQWWTRSQDLFTYNNLDGRHNFSVEHVYASVCGCQCIGASITWNSQSNNYVQILYHIFLFFSFFFIFSTIPVFFLLDFFPFFFFLFIFMFYKNCNGI